MLSDRSLNIAILDVRQIIRHFRDRFFFPRKILALDDSCELARRVGIVASLLSDVVTFRYFADFSPPLHVCLFDKVAFTVVLSLGGERPQNGSTTTLRAHCIAKMWTLSFGVRA